MTGRDALVTGASSGIGAASVRALAAAGWRVTAVARRRDRLETLAAETGCALAVADVRDGSAMAGIAAQPFDLVVANAGLGRGITGLVAASDDDIALTVETNVTAVLHLLRLTLPGMIARRRGHVVLIGSVAGLYPINSAIYGGSKGAIRQIARNLRLELRGSSIRVTEIQPGRVSTEFYDAALATDLKETPIRELDPAEIADAILYAVSAPAHVNVSAIELQPVGQVFGGVAFDE